MDRQELVARISIDPHVCLGKPCIRGHRIWVSLILDFLASGISIDEILEEYPGIEEADVRACIAYGAEISRERYERCVDIEMITETRERSAYNTSGRRSSLRVFDCDISYGRGSVALPREIETVADLLAEMAHSGIDEGLVWHRDAYERDFESGNQRLTECAAHPRLHPTMTFVPTCCNEMPSAGGFIEQMRAHGARAVRAFPTKDCFSLDPVACGDLFAAFTASGIPVLIPLSEVPGGWEGVYALMRNFPQLRLILTETGCWGQDRYFRPLMRAYPGFRITMNRFETAGQLKSLIDRCGCNNLLFGSGLPRNYPGGYILSLMRADISDEARQAVAHGNIERMLGEVPW